MSGAAPILNAPILEAIENAEEVADPFERLVKGARSDPGAPFEEAALDLLASL